MLTYYSFNLWSVDSVETKFHTDFQDEMRFDVKCGGDKSPRNKSMKNSMTSPAIRTGSIKGSLRLLKRAKVKPHIREKTNFSYTDGSEICVILNWLKPEKKQEPILKQLTKKFPKAV